MDINERAKNIINVLLGKAKSKDPLAVELGRRGGKARAKNLSAEQRKQISEKANKERWNKD